VYGWRFVLFFVVTVAAALVIARWIVGWVERQRR